MPRVLFQTCFLVLLFVSAVSATDISGKWLVKMSGFEGNEEFEITIKASGEKLQVTAQHPSYDEMTGSGRLKGDAIKFKLEPKDGEPISIEFKGTILGNKMSGTRTMDFGGGPGGFGGPDGMGGPPGGFPGGPMGGGPDTSKISKEWTAERK
jgi:hypothetical protein